MISVIIPIYNAEETLEKCLESMLRQTYLDFEVILINDGSTDNSEYVCKRYVDNSHGKVRYYKKENGGVSSARNMGIKKAQGEYICFVDSDDYVDDTYLEVLMSGIMDYDVDFSMCDIIRNTKGNTGDTVLLEGKDDIVSSMMSSQYGSLNRGPYCKIFLRKILQDGLRFAEDIYLGEDTLFCVEYAKRCKRGVYIRKGLYHYDLPTSSIAYRTGARMLTKYLTYIDSRRRMLEDTSMLNRNSFVLIVNSLFEAIQESYFVARRTGNRTVQQELCKTMKMMRDNYALSMSEQMRPVSWWVMANQSKRFDTWMYLYGKWHGFLKKIGL